MYTVYILLLRRYTHVTEVLRLCKENWQRCKRLQDLVRSNERIVFMTERMNACQEIMGLEYKSTRLLYMLNFGVLK